MQNISAANRHAALLCEFEGSGLTMAEICRRREVGLSTMAAWRRACRPSPQPSAFVEVEALGVSGAEPGTERSQWMLCAELMLPGGTVLRVYQIPSTGGTAS